MHLLSKPHWLLRAAFRQEPCTKGFPLLAATRLESPNLSLPM